MSGRISCPASAVRRVVALVPLALVLAGCEGEAPEAAPVAPGSGEPAGVVSRGGSELARTLGCGACHRGVPAPDGPLAAPLGPAAGHEPAFIFSYVLDPAADAVPAQGPRMPSFHLSEAESLALALYLSGDGEGARGGRRASAAARRAYREARRGHPDVDRETGRRIFVALNCAGCHPHAEAAPWRNGPDLAREAERARPEWLAAWLRAPTAIRPFGHRPGTGGRMPDFRLGRAEADSLAAFLLAGGAVGTEDVPPGPAEDLPEGSAGDLPPGSDGPAPLTAHARRTAAGLLRDRLPCLGCHRLGDDGGRLGPDLSTVARRRPDGYVRAIVASPDATAPGTAMPRVPLTESRRRLVTAFLLAPGEDAAEPTAARAGPDDVIAGPATAGPRRGYLSLVDHVPRPPTAGEAEGRTAEATGHDAYARRCGACHGSEGRGDGFNARYLPTTPTPHASPAHMSARPSSTLFDGVYAGGRILGKSHRMPPFGHSLPRERIWDLVAHMRALCACRGPGWSRDNGEVPERVERAGAARADGAPPPGGRP